MNIIEYTKYFTTIIHNEEALQKRKEIKDNVKNILEVKKKEIESINENRPKTSFQLKPFKFTGIKPFEIKKVTEIKNGVKKTRTKIKN